MNLTLPTKILLCLASLMFLLGVATVWFVETRADVTELRRLFVQQGGYPGIPDYRHGSTPRNSTGYEIGVAFVTYEYNVDGQNFSGVGLARAYDGESVLIKYLSLRPAISVSSGLPYFLFSGFFLFLALGVRSVVLWVRRIMSGKDN